METYYVRKFQTQINYIFHAIYVVKGELKTPDGNDCQVVNGLPEPSCRLIDEENLSNRYASLMYRTNLNHVSSFFK